MTDLSGAGVRVLILATASHPASTLPDLPAVASSCHALREAFVHRCGVDERNITTVLDAPDALSMARAITREAARAESVLLVYYLGHGLLGPDGELFLAASDTGEELDPGLATFQALSFDTVGKALRGCRAPSVVVILDCCFYGWPGCRYRLDPGVRHRHLRTVSDRVGRVPGAVPGRAALHRVHRSLAAAVGTR